MAEVLLFHHAQGQTPGVLGFADELRGAGHTVHTPDLFDGRTFDTIDDGLAYAGEVGFGAIIERGVRAADGPARRARVRRVLARRDAGAEAGADPAGRPRRVAVPLVRPAVGVRRRVAGGRAGADPRHGRRPVLRRRGRHRRRPRHSSTSAADAELFLYPGDQHLFADSSLPSYDAAAAPAAHQPGARLPRHPLTARAPAHLATRRAGSPSGRSCSTPTDPTTC